ncbi:MAG: asparagine synthase (glutamine-hydrolyzing) [Elusimicrobiaceae bacterium]|nr:asparagine synthase (glutamine-hydrolyzing) [Elusimicrobiaceae bacterium]
MCGIYGIFNYGSGQPVGAETLDGMGRAMLHRGPDDSGSFTDGGLGIGMRRLSIIDLSTGHQPLSNEDGSLWIVFNGEIYNFHELRDALVKQGHKFRTQTDTEAIVHLYEQYGKNCVDHLRGMFAFAIWDKTRKTLFAARDRIGKKPFLYSDCGGRFVFASEFKALFAAGGVPGETDPGAIDLFLSLQYIPSPQTVYRHVRKLPPAHRLLLENGRLTIEPYWDLPLDAEPLKAPAEELKEMIVSELRESVRLRMIADVPLGAFLSGGVDSSVIVALMSELSDRPVKTFSIGFDVAEYTETRYARMVADRYGCEHREFTVKPDMAGILPKLVSHYGEPYADPSALPSYYVAHETRKHVTVALNGDGGDENFAGYLRYLAMNLGHYWDYLPQPLRRAAAAAAEFLPEHNAPKSIFWRGKRFLRSTVFSDFKRRHLKMLCYFSEDEKAGLYSDKFKALLSGGTGGPQGYIDGFYRTAQAADFINRMLYVDMKSYLPECLMTKIDIATMANSLEGRSPLLDHKFMELVFRIPGKYKLHNVTGSKWLLKEAFRDKLPPAITRRGKMGFGIPLGPWFRGELKKFWEEHCLSSEALNRGYFRPETVQRYWDEHQSGKRDHGYRLWALLMLELWHEDARLVIGGGKIV